MKRTFLIAIVALGLNGAVSNTYAQQQADLEKLSSQLDGVLTKLETVMDNIQQMTLALNEADYGWSRGADIQIERAHNYFRQVWNTAQIAEVVRDPQDYQRVLRYLRISCKTAKTIGDNVTKSLNSSLVRMNAKALIAEIRAARDLIQSLNRTPLCEP